MLAETTGLVSGIATGSGSVGVLWAAVALVSAARKRNGNGRVLRPGEGVVCRQHGEALAAGAERFKGLQDAVISIRDEVKSISDKLDRALEKK